MIADEYKGEFSENLLKGLVDWMIKVGTEKTLYGNYIISYGDIESEFIYFDKTSGRMYRLTKAILEANHEAILNEIDSREEILSETWNEYDGDNLDGFNMNFCLDACGLTADDAD